MVGNKKIGLCICHDVSNHGSMLQCLATLKFLEKFQCKYEILRYSKDKSFLSAVKSLPRLLNKYLIEDKIKTVSCAINNRLNPEFKKYRDDRYSAVKEFKKRFFEDYYSPVIPGLAALTEYAKKFDAVLSGSDQLWSPAGLPTNFFNLMFVPAHIRKISYASSFGTASIPFYQTSRTRQYLERIEFISVRENSGKKIVDGLTNRDVPVVLDPTLLFDRSDWERFIPVKNNQSGPYIFAYFLGENSSHRRIVTEFAKQKGIKLVALKHLDRFIKADVDFGDETPKGVGAEEFVNLIRHAEYVFTDSFHGSVFSILHHKKFVTFNRYSATALVSKNTRIDSLFENLGITGCRYSGNLQTDASSIIDYNNVDEKLLGLREKSFNYIKQSLDFPEL